MASFSESFAAARKKFDSQPTAANYTFTHGGQTFNVLKKGETRASLFNSAKPSKPAPRPSPTRPQPRPTATSPRPRPNPNRTPTAAARRTESPSLASDMASARGKRTKAEVEGIAERALSRRSARSADRRAISRDASRASEVRSKALAESSASVPRSGLDRALQAQDSRIRTGSTPLARLGRAIGRAIDPTVARSKGRGQSRRRSR